MREGRKKEGKEREGGKEEGRVGGGVRVSWLPHLLDREGGEREREEGGREEEGRGRMRN